MALVHMRCSKVDNMISTLQAGRAVAAMSVAAFHLSIMMAATRYGGVHVFGEYTRYGKHGVDFFFVLSGFIILLAHERDIGRPQAWGNYLYRRFVRVYPIYWLYTLVFVAVLMMAGGTDASLPDTLPDWLASLSLIRFTSVNPPLGQAWTLFHEVAFYTVFSVLILNRTLGMLALAAFVAVIAIFHQDPPDFARTARNVYTGDYNLYFVFGMGAFLWYRKGGKGLVETLGGLSLSVAALAIPGLGLDLSRLALALGLALMLAGLAKLETSGSLRIPRWLAFVGNASYSIYLTHINVEGLLLKIAAKLHLRELLGPAITYAALLAATVGAGCLAYVLVERPLLALFGKRQGRTKGSQPLRLREHETSGR
jgi:peptidoglycan/LPS O-acetylase OafA/YrhL